MYNYVQQSSVISLSKLIVREKADSRDGCGLYLICQSRQSPEMYELVCRSIDDRRAWTATLKQAIANCPQQSIGLMEVVLPLFGTDVLSSVQLVRSVINIS